MSGEKISIDDAYAYLIYRTARLLRRDFTRMAEGLGPDRELTPEQWFILNKLKHRDGRSQVDLGDEIFKDRANITRILNTMEKRELVRRREDPEDKRKFRIHLTARGRELHDAFASMAMKERKRVYKGLNRGDFAELKRILGIIEENLHE